MEEPIHSPTQAELPSKQQLNRATLIAAGVAALLLFTTVLPAEYGYDPTGVGRLFGLTPMGEMKRDQSQAAAAEAPEADSGDLVLDEPTAPAAATVSGETGDMTL